MKTRYLALATSSLFLVAAHPHQTPHIEKAALAADKTVEKHEVTNHDFVSDKPDLIIMTSIANVPPGAKLDKGEVADRKYWPGVLDTKICTAALVGPDTILTAAHCVDAETENTAADPTARYKTVTAKLDWFGTIIDLDCEMNPLYASAPVNKGNLRNDHDHALCFVTGKTPTRKLANNAIISGKIYEAISLDDRYTSQKSKATLTGYGCYGITPYKRLDVPSGDIFYDVDFRTNVSRDTPRKLRVGNDSLDFTTTDLLLKTSSNGKSNDPSVCPGDSGGPIFSGHSEIKPPDADQRFILGVNSTISMVSLYKVGNPFPDDYQLRSNFASLSTPTFISFLEDWASRKNTKVCLDGYTGGKNIISSNTECRNVGAGASPPVAPTPLGSNNMCISEYEIVRRVEGIQEAEKQYPGGKSYYGPCP